MNKKIYNQINWSNYSPQSNETEVDTNNSYFTQELPEDDRNLNSDGENV